jgi:hypothetical protein
MNEMCFPRPKRGLTWVSMWIRGGVVMNLLVSAIAIVLGAFVMVAPDRAAAIWGAERFQKLAPADKPLFLQWYRVFGVTLCLAAILFALDSLAFR